MHAQSQVEGIAFGELVAGTESQQWTAVAGVADFCGVCAAQSDGCFCGVVVYGIALHLHPGTDGECR